MHTHSHTTFKRNIPTAALKRKVCPKKTDKIIIITSNNYTAAPPPLRIESAERDWNKRTKEKNGDRKPVTDTSHHDVNSSFRSRICWYIPQRDRTNDAFFFSSSSRIFFFLQIFFFFIVCNNSINTCTYTVFGFIEQIECKQRKPMFYWTSHSQSDKLLIVMVSWIFARPKSNKRWNEEMLNESINSKYWLSYKIIFSHLLRHFFLFPSFSLSKIFFFSI